MRLWSLHPKFLDGKGLVALWREGLLAKAVLQGKTRGYRQHPQLERWRAAADPVASINSYLAEVWAEADRRGYSFDRRKLGRRRGRARIGVTWGLVGYEWRHLMRKLRGRDPERRRKHSAVARPAVHPLFRIVAGPVASWEREPKAGSSKNVSSKQ
jgi:hypothetical protein